jgi:hypothetical protein
MVKKLYLVPIIHMSADMGSLASALSEYATAKLGQKMWQKHKEIVSGFWNSIARFFDSMNVNGFKIYQDGLVANGEEGLMIVRQGVKEGSRNYEIILGLVQRGAIIVRTEDITLAKKEYSFITKMAQARSLRQRATVTLRYKLDREKILRQRDNFIATRIKETLKEGETGILFIGAYHDVVARLASDISVIQVKEVAKVKQYHRILTGKKQYRRYFEQLAQYLVEPVLVTPQPS